MLKFHSIRKLINPGNYRFFKQPTTVLLLVIIGLALISLIFHQNILNSKTSPLSVFESKLESIVNSQNPQEALNYLNETGLHYPEIQRECHSFTHSIGRMAYTKYHNLPETLEYQSDLCNQGYLHGVFEGYFSEQKTLPGNLNQLCNSYREQSFKSWQCYHGLGHGVMLLSQNNLETALINCQAFPDSYGRSNCANGVYMEYFTFDTLKKHKSAVPQNDILSACDKEKVYSQACYFYAPTYFLGKNNEAYDRVWQLCDGIPDPNNKSCAVGVGYETMRQKNNDIKTTEEICSNAPDEYKSLCIMGMINWIINFNGSLDPAVRTCPLLKPANQLTCEKTIIKKTPEFTN